MPTITLFNPKGGSGKTTTGLILAGELASRGASVAMIDGDPNPNLHRWAEKRGLATLDTAVDKAESEGDALGLIDDRFNGAQFVAVRNRDSISVPDWIDALSQRYSFTICDPEGTANDWVNHAVAMSDLVVIPLRPAPMDADQMLRAVKLIEAQSKAARRKIEYRILFTCTGTLMTRDEREIREFVQSKGYPIMATSLVERAAFRAMVAKRKLLSELPEKGPDAVTNLKTARENAAAVVGEIIEALKAVQEAA